MLRLVTPHIVLSMLPTADHLIGTARDTHHSQPHWDIQSQNARRLQGAWHEALIWHGWCPILSPQSLVEHANHLHLQFRLSLSQSFGRQHAAPHWMSVESGGLTCARVTMHHMGGS